MCFQSILHSPVIRDNPSYEPFDYFYQFGKLAAISERSPDIFQSPNKYYFFYYFFVGYMTD